MDLHREELDFPYAKPVSSQDSSQHFKHLSCFDLEKPEEFHDIEGNHVHLSVSGYKTVQKCDVLPLL